MIRSLRNLALLFLCVFVQHKNYGQDYELIHIDKNQGLSNSWITCLHQDSKGMIWVGTMLGLNRYDGHQIKTYVANQTKRNRLRGNYIIGINEDKQGLLWISSSEGLSLFDPMWNRFEYIQDYNIAIQAQSTSKTIIDGKGKIWFYQQLDGKPTIFCLETGENMLYKLRKGKLSKNDFKIKKINLPPDFGNKVMYLKLKDENHILLAGNNANFFLLHTESSQFKKVDVKDFSITLKDGTMILKPERGRNSTIIYPNTSFKEEFTLPQMAEVLWLPDGRQLLARYYDQNLYDITREVQSKKEIPLNNLQKKLKLPDPQSIARMVDAEGNVWIGSAGNGLYLFRLQNGFQLYAKESSFYNVESIASNYIWQGIFNKRQVLHLPSGKMQDAPWSTILPKSTEVVAVKTSTKSQKSYLLCKIGMRPGMTLFEYNPTLQIAKRINLTLSFVDIPKMLEDHEHNIWILGTNGEIARYNTLSGSIKKWDFSHFFPNDKQNRLLPRSMALSESGLIWCALDEGILCVQNNLDSVTMKVWHNYTDKGVVFPNPGVSCVFPDPADKKVVWMGSQGSGLCRFDTQNNTLECFQNDVWPIFEVVSIQPDLSGHLWVSSEKGLSCFDLASKRYIGFRFKDVLSRLEYNPTSYIAQNNGKLYFGTWSGLLEIDPQHLIHNLPNSAIELSDVIVNGKEIENPDDVFYNNKDGQLIIRLSHFQNNILMRFCSPGSQADGGMTFEFRIPEYSDHWVPIDVQGALQLNGLSSGTYSIEIRRAESITDNSPTNQLNITLDIKFPWYFSIPARIIYMILIIAFFVYLFKRKKKEVEKKYAAELQANEVQRLQYMDNFRRRFTAYLAHEFKTPLTIIIGLVELMKQNFGHTPPEEYLDSIQKEGNEMLDLVGEMMDVMKLEEGKLRIHREYYELSAFLKDSVSGFIKLANLQQINLVLSLPEEPIDLHLDPLRTKYILNNLLSNALRHTPIGGTIKIEARVVDENFVEIKILDTGEGIPEEKLPFIFDRYYQVESQDSNNHNFGIGLTFVKEMVEALGGIIRVESKLGKGTNFIFTLPIENVLDGLSHEENRDEIFVYPASISSLDENIIRTNKPLLLICEDNLTILSYLEIFLQSSFDVLKARNGEEGLKMAIELLPDLILTDINMPIMDGLTMMKSIKSHALTNHIPVIMLTGKTEVEDKILGKESGADAYIGKPFHYRELLLTLQNQYSLQQKWKEKFTAEINQIIEQYGDSNAENTSENNLYSFSETDSSKLFLDSLMEAFENNYTIEQFDTVQLCKAMFISRTQLYRKIAAFTDESPMEMLRNFRLKKAAELLISQSDLSIQEVFSNVGFKERTHFNAIFQKKYNMSPTEYKKKYRNTIG